MTKGMKMNLVASSAVVFGLVLYLGDAQSASTHAKVASAPVCDLQAHPKIIKVSPDTVKAGQRITIKGNKFGSKECFQNVSFGSTGTKEFKYVNDSTVEVTVPDLKPGMVPVNILTAGGSAQFMVLVKK